MLLNDFKMNVDDANFHTKLTETQRELVQKFNTAFYEAQNKTPLHQINDDDDNILDTFDEKYFTNIENYEDAAVADGDGCFFDLILPKVADCPNPPTPGGDPTNFDYDDFSEKFEQQVQDAALDETYINFDEVFRVKNPSVSTTETTSTSRSNEFRYDDRNASPFFVPLPFETKTSDEQFENLELSDIDLSENLSNASLDFDRFDFNCDVKVKLPPVNTIVKNNIDFNNILRTSAPNSLILGQQENLKYSSYGHLIGVKSINNNISTSYVIEDFKDSAISNNHSVMRQNDALMYDDPLLCSGSLLLPKRMRKNTADSQDSELSTDCEEIYVTGQLQCQWENCFQIYDSQGSLVRHIEKCHVELKRGEEFTCFWLNCPRKTKPFNARYKLLIHMRVHSGEKPNKCPFKGCKKAFSRLENLKIHQRSHTGERPYLCQFSNCTKSFSNSSDRAKHQRTHFDTKPYACQVLGCSKKYTDPSSLRKHVKNHTYEEQVQLKKKAECKPKDAACSASRKIDTKQKFSASAAPNGEKSIFGPFYTTLDHSYSNSYVSSQYILSAAVKQDLKNKISEKISKEKLIVMS